jgi:hypothetical protein
MEICQKTVPLLGINPKRVLSQHTKIKTPAHPCLLQHYSQKSTCGISIGAHQQMNGYRKCGILHNGVYYSAIKKIELGSGCSHL